MHPHIPCFIEAVYQLLPLQPHFSGVSQGFIVDLQDFSLSWEIKLQSKHCMYFGAALLLTGEENPTLPEMLQKEYGCLGSSMAAWEGWYLKCTSLS